MTPAGPGTPCSWCKGPIPAVRPDTGRKVRDDALTCSKRCRQASYRFGHRVPEVTIAEAQPMRFAYADPPYPGMSWRYYRDHPDYAGEVDHTELLERLIAEYPDGWALSTSNKTLRQVLHMVPGDVDVRIGAWTKRLPPQLRSRRAITAWEPVLFAGGRRRPPGSPMLHDWIHAAPPRTLPGQVMGTKPSTFSVWVFEMLGAQAIDTLDDLYPGSGAVARAWERYASPPGADDASCSAAGDASQLASVDASRRAAAPNDASRLTAVRRDASRRDPDDASSG